MPNGLTFNPHVAALPIYNAGLNIEAARKISGREDMARLASNENPDGCSPKVREALASAAFEPGRYADPHCVALRAALADYLSADPAAVVVGNGSEELIAAISRALLRPGDEVVTVVPSFGLHEIEPLAVGARVRKVPMTGELGFDIAALETAIAAGPRLIFLSSPWNPVGPALTQADFERLIAAVQPGTLLAFDEAYFEYASDAIPDGLEVLRASAIPYVLLRTFSKAYGLAGLRVGYGICSDTEIARVINAAKPPFDVNAAAQAAALAALADQAWMQDSVGRTIAERTRVAAALTALGYRVPVSETNFLFIDIADDSIKVAEALLRQGLIVKPWREPGYTRFIRASLGHAAENDRLIAALELIRKG